MPNKLNNDILNLAKGESLDVKIAKFANHQMGIYVEKHARDLVYRIGFDFNRTFVTGKISNESGQILRITCRK